MQVIHRSGGFEVIHRFNLAVKSVTHRIGGLERE